MKRLSLADTISLYRIFAAPILILVSVLGYRETFIVLFIISILTDLFDGVLARLLRQETNLGWWLDSIGDFLTFLAALVAIVIFQREFLIEHGWGVGVIVVGFLVQVLAGYWKTKNIIRLHTLLAKAASFLQTTFLVALFFSGFFKELFSITVISSVLANIEEIIIFLMYGDVDPNTKGIFWVRGRRERQK
ncbi:CDP-alcohol phosphatidyltransferase family protein [Candidatus Woesearchaeota archaeon]|nr:CDP-alcohol phosphatidyltransferase family protein [Candidatus Woesearchaeota archaeon]